MANTTTILFSTKECKYSSNEFLEFAASICLNAVEGTAFNTIAIISSVHASADPRPRFTFRLYESGKEQPIKLFRPLEVLPYWLRQKHKARGEAGSQDATHHTKMSPGLVEGAERYRLLTTMDREDPNGKDFVAARAQEAGARITWRPSSRKGHLVVVAAASVTRIGGSSLLQTLDFSPHDRNCQA